jgi:hypothetical protein
VSADAGRGSGRRRGALGWTLVAAVLGYAAVVYYGFGPYPTTSEVPWWQPRGFLGESILLAPFGESDRAAIAALSLPAFLLAAGVFLATASALARTLALAGALATGLFLFYGLRFPGPQIWSFFAWRGSAVMLSMALLVAASVLAPLLAAAWLRRGLALRVLFYLPIVALIVAADTSATGTNPELGFNLSPWPVVTVFGFDMIATLVAGLLGCLALALATWRLRTRHVAIAAAGIALAIAIPILWVSLGLPSGLWLLGAALALAVLALRCVSTAAGNLTMGLRSAGGYAALGAILLAIPLSLGRAWVQLDYRATRDDRAQRIIDALAAFYEREGLYPEELDELMETKDLDSIPRPRIGLAAFAGEGFTYQNFGTDYLLEFSAPGWTECAYSPPWEEEFEEFDEFQQFEEFEEEAGDRETETGLGPAAAGLPEAEEEFGIGLGPAAAGLPEAEEEFGIGIGPAAAGLPEAEEEEVITSLPGSWTCPSKPPELW